MRSKRAKIVAIGVLVIVAGIAYALVATAPQVTLTARAFTIIRLSEGLAQRLGKREYVRATIELSNASNRTITYAAYSRESPLSSLLVETPTGWKPPRRGWICGTGLQSFSLAPQSGITFHAEVEQDKPCRVSVGYSDGRKPSHFWKRMPDWLRQRVPWGQDYPTAVSATIDLRNAADLPVVEESYYKPPESIADVLRAAEKGDTEARFRLAGRYWTGDGVEKSSRDALRWYESAAANGHAEAAYNLGNIYEYGLGVTADQTNAIKWYAKAGERGHASSQERLRALASK